MSTRIDKSKTKFAPKVAGRRAAGGDMGPPKGGPLKSPSMNPTIRNPPLRSPVIPPKSPIRRPSQSPVPSRSVTAASPSTPAFQLPPPISPASTSSDALLLADMNRVSADPAISPFVLPPPSTSSAHTSVSVGEEILNATNALLASSDRRPTSHKHLVTPEPVQNLHIRRNPGAPAATSSDSHPVARQTAPLVNPDALKKKVLGLAVGAFKPIGRRPPSETAPTQSSQISVSRSEISQSQLTFVGDDAFESQFPRLDHLSYVMQTQDDPATSSHSDPISQAETAVGSQPADIPRPKPAAPALVNPAALRKKGLGLAVGAFKPILGRRPDSAGQNIANAPAQQEPVPEVEPQPSTLAHVSHEPMLAESSTHRSADPPPSIRFQLPDPSLTSTFSVAEDLPFTVSAPIRMPSEEPGIMDLDEVNPLTEYLGSRFGFDADSAVAGSDNVRKQVRFSDSTRPGTANATRVPTVGSRNVLSIGSRRIPAIGTVPEASHVSEPDSTDDYSAFQMATSKVQKVVSDTVAALDVFDDDVREEYMSVVTSRRLPPRIFSARNPRSPSGEVPSLEREATPEDHDTPGAPSTPPSNDIEMADPEPEEEADSSDEDIANMTLTKLIRSTFKRGKISSAHQKYLEEKQNSQKRKREGSTAADPTSGSKAGTPVASDDRGNKRSRSAASIRSSSVRSTGAAAAAPRVRLVDGRLVVDTLSLVIEEEAEEELEMENVEEGSNEYITSQSFRRPTAGHTTWNKADTERFYQGLAYFGTNFTMIAMMFSKKKAKHIKNKFNVEERKNPKKVTKALRQRRTPDEELLEQIRQERTARKEAELAALQKSDDEDGEGDKVEGKDDDGAAASSSKEPADATEDPLDALIAVADDPEPPTRQETPAQQQPQPQAAPPQPAPPKAQPPPISSVAGPSRPTGPVGKFAPKVSSFRAVPRVAPRGTDPPPENATVPQQERETVTQETPGEERPVAAAPTPVVETVEETRKPVRSRAIPMIGSGKR
ncbi:hypothetical protein BJ742DRAFT_787700, partial [Cladochytrium replicatum]